jgi:hypothetical protein
MQGGINFLTGVLLSALVSIGFAQETETAPRPPAASEANEAAGPALPYVAEITANSVYVRSGPGRDQYPCGQLKKGDTVTVVGTYYSWSKIVPPAGSFSWIHKQYVQIDPESPQLGVVTGDAVGVYVGAEDRDPIRCTRRQLQLNKEDKVELLGELKSDYYKINPPEDAYRWVSTQYTRPLRVLGKPPVPPLPPPSVPIVTPPADTNTIVTPPVSANEPTPLEQYYALDTQLKAERAKPMAQQNYGDLKEKFRRIAENTQAGKAARYAQFALQQIERYELALRVTKAIELQDAQLRDLLSKIDKARTRRLAELQNLGRFAVLGKLLTSTAYGRGYYRIVDNSNKTLCLATPTGNAKGADLSTITGKKVGLIGTIEAHRTFPVALVRFTQAIEIE